MVTLVAGIHVAALTEAACGGGLAERSGGGTGASGYGAGPGTGGQGVGGAGAGGTSTGTTGGISLEQACNDWKAAATAVYAACGMSVTNIDCAGGSTPSDPACWVSWYECDKNAYTCVGGMVEWNGSLCAHLACGP